MLISKQNLLNCLLVAGMFGVLYLLAAAGWNRADLGQQALVVEKNARAVKQGLNYFFNDYDRFPKAREFENEAIMRIYFSGWMPKEFASKSCPNQSYRYVRPAPSAFEIDFCLPAAVLNFKRGWNKL